MKSFIIELYQNSAFREELMGVKERRAKYKDEFLREIIKSAREFFLKEGYEKFTMRGLAKSIDCSPTTIYRYFKDKDELLFAICEVLMAQFLTDIRYIREHMKEPLDALRKALLCMTDFSLDNPDLYKVFYFSKFNVYGNKAEYLERESTARDSYLEFIKIVKACCKAGKMRSMDVELLAQALMVPVVGLITLSMQPSSFPWLDRKVLVPAVVDGILRGYLK
jgi:AcrR family transcriptional regulator